MKKQYSYSILLLAVLFSCTLQAEVKHYLGPTVNVGEWSLWDTSGKSYLGLSLGGGGGVGFTYELQAGKAQSPTRFLLDLGLVLQGGTTYVSMKDSAFQFNTQDSEGDDFIYHYNATGRQDNYTKLAVQVPVLIGVQHKRFYMLAGVKVGYNAFGTWRSRCQVTTYGEYTQFVGQKLEDIPSQQFYKDPQNKEENYRTNTSPQLFPIAVDATLELGGRIGEFSYETGFDVPKRPIEYRLAAFVDFTAYGGYRKYSSGSKILTFPNAYDASTDMIKAVTINDAASCAKPGATINAGEAIGRNVMVGIKFTMLFRMTKKPCVLCDYDALRPSRRFGRRGVHYEE